MNSSVYCLIRNQFSDKSIRSKLSLFCLFLTDLAELWKVNSRETHASHKPIYLKFDSNYNQLYRSSNFYLIFRVSQLLQLKTWTISKLILLSLCSISHSRPIPLHFFFQITTHTIDFEDSTYFKTTPICWFFIGLLIFFKTPLALSIEKSIYYSQYYWVDLRYYSLLYFLFGKLIQRSTLNATFSADSLNFEGPLSTIHVMNAFRFQQNLQSTIHLAFNSHTNIL